MNIKKSIRIDKIVSLIPKCDTLCDMACDHGYIGIKAGLEGKVNKIIFSDINEAPLESCKENANRYLLDKNIDVEFLLGDGLKVLDKNKIYDTLVIAGIGYDLMIEIIKDIKDYHIHTLILSTHTKVSSLRKYLDEHKFDVVNDEMVIEDGKYYYIQKINMEG